ncbi:Uncharacterised protein [Bordetella pertussis]|nr:Uncharacterised protein [Bordetella pertussis]
MAALYRRSWRASTWPITTCRPARPARSWQSRSNTACCSWMNRGRSSRSSGG